MIYNILSYIIFNELKYKNKLDTSGILYQKHFIVQLQTAFLKRLIKFFFLNWKKSLKYDAVHDFLVLGQTSEWKNAGVDT